MSEVIIIAAMAKNRVIGNNNKIPWYIKEDFKHFKELTLNNPIIMGKNTFLSLPKKPLPKRKNIVLTYENDNSLDKYSTDIIIKHSIKNAIDYCKQKNYKQIYIIGGASVYKQSINFVDKIELTVIDKEYQGDTYFPEFDLNNWKLIKEIKKEGFSFITYIKKE
jgi:dihydrofolate reductase